MSLWARDTITRRLIILSSDPASADPLPAGTLENGRYACPVCGDVVSLSRRSGPTSSYTPRFNHRQLSAPVSVNPGPSEGCSARAELRQQVETDVQVVIDLQQKLNLAWPGTQTHIECPLSPGPGQAPPPPVIVAKDPGGAILVIDCPRGKLNEGSVPRRIRAVREHFGPQAMHVWFFAGDPEHFRTDGLQPKAVKPAGERTSIKHLRVRPTNDQLQIIAAGGSVYWLNGDFVLVPYGGHEFEHKPYPNEDWPADSRKDWRISHPKPAPGAAWWGLVPVGLSTLRRSRLAFHPSDAHEVMARLERSQTARWNAVRRRARERYENRQPPTRPARNETASAHPEEPTPSADSEVEATPSPSASQPIPPPPPTPPMPTSPPQPQWPTARREGLFARLRRWYRR